MNASSIRAISIALFAATLSAACLPVRETRQAAVDGLLLDAATRRPLPRGTLLIAFGLSDRAELEYRRYESDGEGRLQVDAVRGWRFRTGLPPREEPASAWLNEHFYMAPGHAWILLSLDERLRRHPPVRVLMHPFPDTVPRMALSEAHGQTWLGRETWEIRVPACHATAQGLREGNGLVVFWDPRYVVMAARLRAGNGGLWLESAPDTGPIRVVAGSKARRAKRAFLDARTCEIRVEEQEESNPTGG